jgi:hypothetical protein
MCNVRPRGLATLENGSMLLTSRPGWPPLGIRSATALVSLLLGFCAAGAGAACAAPDTAAGATPGEPTVIIGVNDGSGWGPADSARFHALGFTSERIVAGEQPTIAQSIAAGWTDDLVIAGNVQDEQPLSGVNIPMWTREALTQVSEAAANGVTLVEVGNEMYAKGPSCEGCGRRVEPARYAEMFVSLARAVRAAHIGAVKLLFDSYGDFQEGEGAPWSQVWSGGGWLAAAVAAEPELRSLVGGFSMHPYGEPGENRSNDGGPQALYVQHEQAVSLGFQHTDFYATEFGVQVEGQPAPSSLDRQAHEIEAVYDELISFGFVKGIWYYQTHDDGTGHWGLVESQETGRSPFIARPSLAVVAAYAQRFQSGAGAGESELRVSGDGAGQSVQLGNSGVEYHPRLELAALPWRDGSYD